MVGDECVVTLSRCWRQCQDEGRDSGPSSLRCCQGRVMAYCLSCVVVVSSQGGRARAHRRCCQGEGDGEGEGASSSSGRGRWQWRGYVVSIVIIGEREWERVMSSSERERVSTSLSIVGEKAGTRVSHHRRWGEGDGEGASSSPERHQQTNPPSGQNWTVLASLIDCTGFYREVPNCLDLDKNP